MTVEKNADMPAGAQGVGVGPSGDVSRSRDYYGDDGLSKREYACIHCGVPATGDPDLDAIIAEGNRIQKAMIDAPAIPYGPCEAPDLTKINVE